MTQSLRLLMAGALACIAGLLLSGALSASALPPRLTTYDQPTTSEGPALASSPTSTALSGTLHFIEVYTYSLAPYGSDSHVAADFDRDGRADIVIAETLRPTLTSRLVLLRNLGNWQFAATTLITYPTAGSYLYTVQAADLNHDLWPDLVLRNHCEIHVLLNDQLGDFTTSWILSDGYRYCGRGLALADMNGDDAIDILAGQQPGGGGRIDLFTNDGSGTVFTLTWQSPLYGEPNAGTMKNLVPAKLNNDAAPDIVASEIYNAVLVTFIGDGTGVTFTQILSNDVGDRTYNMVGGNLNGDALTDVVLNTDGVVRAYTAQGNGTLLETWSDPSVGIGSAQILADFDRDGYDDLFSSSFWTGQLYVYLNRPLSGTFQLVWSGKLPGEIYSVTAADMNGDDYPDLIVGEDSVLHIYRSVFLTQRYILPILLRT